MAICYPLSAYNWLQNEWPRMTLSGYFTPNSVFVPEVSDPEGSAFKDNCVKTSKHRPILSCKSFWQYKSFADIRRRFFQERRQTGVRSLKSTNLQLFHAISSEVSEITSALIANWRHTVLDFCRHQQGWRRMTLNARFNLKWALRTARLTYVHVCCGFRSWPMTMRDGMNMGYELCANFRRRLLHRGRRTGSVVNKDLSFKAKAKAKDLTSEHVQGPL